MTLVLHPEERAVIDAMLRFANLKRAKTVKAIEGLFADVRGFDPPPLHAEARTVGTYFHEQQIVREWLTRIAAMDGTALDDQGLTGDVAGALLDVQVTQTFERRVVKRRSQWRLTTNYRLPSVYACCALAVGLLLDETKRLTSRLARCGAPKCGKFHLALNAMGRPRRHCSEACKLKANAATVAERVREHRRKKAKNATSSSHLR